MTAPRWWRGINARSARAPRFWTWTTIWRSWRASPGRCPGPPRWFRPGLPRCSPPSTTPGGPPPAKLTVTRQAPAHWWRCCCCTATWIEPTWWPVSAPHCRWAPPVPMWWRWKRAGPPNVVAPVTPNTGLLKALAWSSWLRIGRRRCWSPMSARCRRVAKYDALLSRETS